MRIALACHNFPPEFQGGTERVVEALAKALVALGHEVVVIAGSERPHRGQDVEVEARGGIVVLRIPRHREESYGLDLRRARVLMVFENLLIEHRIEVLHVHHWSTLSVRLVRSARALGIAAVVTLHDMWTTCGRFFRRPPPGITCPVGAGRTECVPCGAIDVEVAHASVKKGIAMRDGELRQELAAAQVITAPSRACADAIAAHLPWSGSIQVIPHGLLEPVTGTRMPRREGAPFRVGTFGNLVREKGVRVLMEAMAGIPGAELHLHGPCLDPGFAEELERLAARTSVPTVFHGPYVATGRHPAEELDLAVFPSLCQETYGLVVEEALARRVPVIVSDLGALRDHIGRGGLVVEHGSVPALHEALTSIVGSPLRHAELISGIPREFATMATAARSYERIYQAGTKLAAEPARGRDRSLAHVFPPLLPKEHLVPPVLVLAAHPDDEVIACGGMLAWHAQAGHAVTVVHVTDGAKGDPAGRYADIREVRRREGREALARLGITDARSLGFVDGEVPEAVSLLGERLQELFAVLAPRTLYSFFATESHRDHRAVALATVLAAHALPAECRVLLFGVNQVVSGGTMFDVSAFMERKQHALAAFASQLAYNDFKTKILHRDHAATVNVEDKAVTHAEIFADVRPQDLVVAHGVADALAAFMAGGSRS